MVDKSGVEQTFRWLVDAAGDVYMSDQNDDGSAVGFQYGYLHLCGGKFTCLVSESEVAPAMHSALWWDLHRHVCFHQRHEGVA